MGVEDCNISPYCPYPGSELYKELRENGQIKALDDNYFQTLQGQFDFFSVVSYCKNVSGIEIAIYRILGMICFYLLSFVRRPIRLIRIFRITFFKNAKARSLFEQRVLDSRKRNELLMGNK